MSTTPFYKLKIQQLKQTYDQLKSGKEALLTMIDEAEVAESVYNSNAIENSTLTLRQTEQILLELESEHGASLRELFEAKNLARVEAYTREKITHQDIDIPFILLLHQLLLANINDAIAGRFRKRNEFVRVGTHIGAPPHTITTRMNQALTTYSSSVTSFPIDRISRFHVEFEQIHPFVDGNGRIGRVLINYQLGQYGFPNIIIFNKEKHRYYRACSSYTDDGSTKHMEYVINLALIESLQKRIAYLKGLTIIPVSVYAKQKHSTLSSLLNAAKRQTIPAFREKGVWKIGV